MTLRWLQCSKQKLQRRVDFLTRNRISCSTWVSFIYKIELNYVSSQLIKLCIINYVSSQFSFFFWRGLWVTPGGAQGSPWQARRTILDARESNHCLSWFNLMQSNKRPTAVLTLGPPIVFIIKASGLGLEGQFWGYLYVSWMWLNSGVMSRK